MESNIDWKNAKILVTGSGGFLGSNMVELLKAKGCTFPGNLLLPRQKSYDLTNEMVVRNLFEVHRPEYVIHLAGLVGGILPNKYRPAEFFLTNLMVGTLVMHYAWMFGAKKFVAAGAGCGYPEFASIPLKEASFWEGMPQKESAPYSLAKRLLSIQAKAYYDQYNFPAIICIPGNIYGPCDNFNLLDAHLVPALVRKFVEAVDSDAASVEVWGTGTPTRDFVYASDVVEGMLKALEVYNTNQVVNISSGEETSVKDIVGHLAKITGFKGDIRWNLLRPDGQARRCFDITKCKEDLNFAPQMSIIEGLQKTVDWYRANQYKETTRK